MIYKDIAQYNYKSGVSTKPASRPNNPRPVELPLDPRFELRLKVADPASIVYRRLLRGIAAGAPT